jgi:hypothetical protein
MEERKRGEGEGDMRGGEGKGRRGRGEEKRGILLVRWIPKFEW